MPERITIIEDTRQQARKHTTKHEGWTRDGVNILRCALPFGDYATVPPRVVDTKKDIYELAMDIDQEHERFRAECVKAQEAGTTLYVLVENIDGVTDLKTLMHWKETDAHYNMRRRVSGNPNARKIDGVRLAKACTTMASKYGVVFVFCRPERAHEVVLELLLGKKRHE